MQYLPGDYIKVEFMDEVTGLSEWMWVRITCCDDQKRIAIGTLDNVPLNDCGDRIALGSELAVSYSQIREHRKAIEFKKH